MRVLIQMQGSGILQSQRERQIICNYEEKFGLRELRAKINDKAKFKLENMQPFRLAIAAEFCYGTVGVEISRKYLDSGPLEEEFAALDVLIIAARGEKAGFEFVTLIASAMTLGCTIPTKSKNFLRMIVKSKGMDVFCTPEARAQLDKATLSYVDGTPYDFGNTTMYENNFGKMFVGSTTTTSNVGCVKFLKTILPNGKDIPQIIGPPDDEELGVTPIHPYEVCASCGGDRLKANGGEKLLVCSKCKTRQYCSKACQKKNWTLHKPICSRPKEDMETFLNSIPLDFAADAHPDYDKMVGGSGPVTVVSGPSLDDVSKKA